MPDCPKCGKNQWYIVAFGPGGCYICALCGYIEDHGYLYPKTKEDK